MITGRLLIVDDDPAHLRSLGHLLTASGHEVETASDGAEALEIIPARADLDVVLLDLNMPGVDGFAVLEATGSMPMPPRVIVVSGEDGDDVLRRLLQLGAFDFLRKPYEPGDLLKSIHTALSQQRHEADAREVLARVRESDRLHRFLVDQSPDVIYMLDPEGRFSFVSISAEAVFGRDREALEGNHWSMLFGPGEVRRGRFRFDERRTGHRATTNLEMQLKTGEDGVARWIEISATGLYTQDEERRFVGTYGVARDVSDRRRIASALVRSERKFATLFQSSPDALFISSSEDGRILERNEHYDTLVADFEHTDADLWLFESDGARLRFIRSLQERGGIQRRELVRTARDGSERTLELSVRLLTSEDGVSLVSILRDVTVDREREQERLRLEGQLQQTRRLEAIGQLSGGIAHDFNNILASMIGYAELAQVTLEGTEVGARCENYLTEVIAGGQRARDLIAQLLNFSRTEEGDRRAVAMQQELEGILRMLRAVIPTSIAIESRIPETLPTVLADPVQLQQVVINLFINAREAISGEGSIELTVEEVSLAEKERCAACHSTFDGRWLRMSVRDDGRGIPEEIQDQLFDRLVTTRVAGRSTGFGLSLINGFMHQHGGHVQVSSSVGEGSCFRLYFPLAESDAPMPPEAVEPETPALSRGPGAHVVVVDDEVSVANFMSELLEHAGYRTTVFNDPGSALEFLRGDSQVDLLITDQTMPHMSGIELAASIEDLPAAPPVILCTGYGNALPDDDSIEGQHNVRARLSKPFRLKELLDTVHQFLDVGAVAER